MYKLFMGTEESYRRALQEAIREYQRLSRERTRLDERLVQLVQSISTLAKLCRLTPTVQLGLTDACRMALRAAGHPLTAGEMRAQLDAMGFDCSKYSNPLASIHTVLRRLCRSGEVKSKPRPYDKPAFSWKSPPRIVALSKSTDLSKLDLWGFPQLAIRRKEGD